MRPLILAAGLALALLACIPAAGQPASDPTTARAHAPTGVDADGDYRGVRIQADHVALPEHWTDGQERVEASIVPHDHRGLARAVARAALDKYPQRVLDDHLNHVQLVGRLAINGHRVGGLNSGTLVFISTGESDWPSGPRTEGALHHEFAHVLLSRCAGKLDRGAFQAHNPPGFRYAGGVMEAVAAETPGLLRWDDELARDGFVNTYATLSPVEDFCEVARLLFQGDRRLREACAVSERLAGKVRAVKAFYGAVDPAFTEAYFDSLAPLRGPERPAEPGTSDVTFGIVSVERVEGNEHEVNLVVAVMGSPAAIKMFGPGMSAAFGYNPSEFVRGQTEEEGRSWFVDRRMHLGQGAGTIPGRVVLDDGARAMAVHEVRIALDEGFAADSLLIRWTHNQMSLGEESGDLVVGFTQPAGLLTIGPPKPLAPAGDRSQAAGVHGPGAGPPSAEGAGLSFERDDPSIEFGKPLGQPGRSVLFEQADEVEFERVRDILTAELERYPEGLVERVLDQVVVVATIKKEGTPAPSIGTTASRDIYIAARGAPDWVVARAFHHELSVLLIRRYGDGKLARAFLNDPPFEYLGWDEYAKRARGTGQRYDDALNAAGFVRLYSTKSADTDRGTIAEELFRGTKEFWRRKDEHERLGSKTDALIAFYAGLSPEFSEAVFRGYADLDDLPADQP